MDSATSDTHPAATRASIQEVHQNRRRHAFSGDATDPIRGMKTEVTHRQRQDETDIRQRRRPTSSGARSPDTNPGIDGKTPRRGVPTATDA